MFRYNVFLINYLINDCFIQEKCHQEITNVLGDSELSLDHSQELNYCQAVLAEIQRHGQVAVTSVMHRVTVQVRTLFTGNLLIS